MTAAFLSLCLAAVTLPVHAADVFSAEGLVEMLPAGAIVGDGETPLTLRIVALNADGSPVTDARFKLTASDGKVGDVIDAGNGLITVTWTPPAVKKATDVELTLRGRNAAGPVAKKWGVAVSPTLPSGMKVTSNPGYVTLNQDKSATLAVQLTEGADRPQSGAKLRARSSAGKVESLTHLGDGRFSARYTPPTVNYPHTSVITFADARDPGRIYGWTAMPLYGNTPYPVRTTANASVIVKVGDREFGPFETDNNGSAKVPIIVPPGTESGTLLTVKDGKTTETKLDLKVPEARRITLVPAPVGVPSDGSSAVPVRAVVTDAAGDADTGAKVRLTASAGTISDTEHEGNGVYRATWTPPQSDSASTARISAALDGEPGVQSDAVEVNLVPARAGNLSLTVDEKLPEGATGFQVGARVTGAGGAGLAGRAPTFAADGATQKGSVSDAGDGNYEATFSLTGGDVTLTGAVAATPTGNPVSGLVVLPSRDRLPPDGATKSLLNIVSVDKFGYPVAGVPVKLTVVSGEGSVPGETTTDDSGIAQVAYTAGGAAGVVTLKVTAGDAVGGAALLQFPAGVADGLLLPSGGSEWTRDTSTAWAGVINSATLEQEGDAVAAAPARARTTADTTARLSVTSATAEVAPGGTVEISIRVLDEDGRGVAGETLELDVLPTSGAVSAVTDVGDGTYKTKLTAPSEGDMVKLIVSTSAGEAQVLKVPISGASPWDTGAVTEATDAESTDESTDDGAADAVVEEPKEVKEPREPRESGDWTWLRAKVAGVAGTYSYEQTPTEADGPLWNQSIAFEYPAATAGFAADASVWLDALNVPYVGAEVDARFTRYTTTWPNQSTSEIPDWVPYITALGKARYPFASGGSQFHVGAKAGLLYGDFITYRKGGDNDQLIYEPLPLAGLGLGAELGAELSPGVFINAGIVEGLRGASIFATNIDAEVGYDLPFGGYVSAGYQLSRRSIPVVAGDALVEVGTLEDASNLFLLGFGYRL